MKLRLPLMLLSAVLAAYPVVYGANVDLQPSGNSPDTSCGLTSSLSMTNTSMETIASLLVHDLKGETSLTLGSGGLTVTGELIFEGASAGMGMHIDGSSLFTGGLSVTGRGTLSIGADLKMGEGLKTTVSGDAKSVVNLSNVVLEGGEIVFASEGETNVKKVTVGALGGTLTWEGKNTLDFSKILNFTSGNATLTLNTGEAGLVLNNVVAGTGATLNLASGNMSVVQGQTQNFKVDAGAELTFDVTASAPTASGSFSGKGTVILANRTGASVELSDKVFGSNWADFGGRLVLDGGGKYMRQSTTIVVGTGLPAGEKAIVEIKNGAQYFDNANASITRTNDWVLSGTGSSEGFGALRATNATYSGNITILVGGASIGGVTGGNIVKLTGNISGDTLSLGSVPTSYDSWFIATELFGDNSGLKGIDVLRGPVTANSATALGRNLNLTSAQLADSTTANYSVVNINDAVTLETFNGIAGTLIDIRDGKSLTVTGTATSSFSGKLAGKGGVNLRGSGFVTLNGDNSTYEGTVTIGTNSVLVIGAGVTSVKGISGAGSLALKNGASLMVNGLSGGDSSLGGVDFSGGGRLFFRWLRQGLKLLGR